MKDDLLCAHDQMKLQVAKQRVQACQADCRRHAYLVLFSNEVHTVFRRADFKCKGLIYYIFSSFDGQTSIDLQQCVFMNQHIAPRVPSDCACSGTQVKQRNKTNLNYSSRN